MESTPAETIAIAFARVLRGLAINAPIGCMINFAEALDALGAEGHTTRANVYWAARSTLVHRPEDLPLFDRAFAVFWDARSNTTDLELIEEVQRITIAMDDGDTEDDSDDESAEANDDPTIQLRFSATEVLRHKDFGAYSDEELRLSQQLMSRLRFVGPPRRSLRLSEARRAQYRPDLRRTVRARRSARAASRCSASGASRASGCGRWCCCSTSADRWSRMRARCCASCRPRSPAGSGWRRSRWAPA